MGAVFLGKRKNLPPRRAPPDHAEAHPGRDLRFNEFLRTKTDSDPTTHVAKSYQMKVPVTGPVRNTKIRRTAKAGRAGGGGAFASHLQESQESVSASATAKTTPAAVDGLLGLQEVDGATNGTSRAKAHAHGLLDRLDELRHGLLLGGIAPGKLRELQAQVRAERIKVSDPQLADILDEIELRAAVELAKYDTSL